MSLVRVSEGGGWVSDLFNGLSKSITAITLVFGFQPFHAGEQATVRAKSGPKPVGRDGQA